MVPTITPRRTAWPTNVELDLLRAGLLPDERARRAWDRWRRATGGVAETQALRLLPLVEWNLRRIAGQPLHPGQEPGFVEVEWLGNRRVIDEVAAVLRAFRDAGIRFLLIKGIALSRMFYPSQALRPIGDVDILVGPERLPAARAIVERLGWELSIAEPDSRVAHLHSLGYERAGSPSVDLHTHALLECLSADADAGFFERARPLDIAGIVAQTLSAADHLLCVCVHGLRWSAAPAIHWVADAAMIVRRSGEDLSWNILIEEARRRRLSLAIERALLFLRAEFEIPIPEEVFSRLSREPSGWQARIEFAARARPPALASGLFLHWRGLAGERPDLSAVRRLGRFPRYLRELWGLSGVWQVPGLAARKGLGRLGLFRSRV